MDNNADIFEAKDCDISAKLFKVVVQQKRVGSEWKIDVRFWKLASDGATYYPLKNGLCIRNSTWKAVILPVITEFLNKYDSIDK